MSGINTDAVVIGAVDTVAESAATVEAANGDPSSAPGAKSGADVTGALGAALRS